MGEISVGEMAAGNVGHSHKTREEAASSPQTRMRPRERVVVAAKSRDGVCLEAV